MNTEEQTQVLANIAQAIANRPTSWRYGQAAFNYAYHYLPTITSQYRGSSVDPFYNDKGVPAFLMAVANDLAERMGDYPSRPTTDDLLALLPADGTEWTNLPEMLGRYSLLRQLISAGIIEVRTTDVVYWNKTTLEERWVQARRVH